MSFKSIINSFIHQKETDYKTFMWKDLTADIRSQIFKQNIVMSDDFKKLVYFIFKVKNNFLILADVDYKTLKHKLSSL